MKPQTGYTVTRAEIMIKALSVLGAGAFVSQTTEYLPVGLLNQIAEHLGISGAKAGMLITVYAWVITLSVIPVTLLTQGIDRKKLFVFFTRPYRTM